MDFPSCPPLLSAVVNTTRDWNNEYNVKYCHFLRIANSLMEKTKNLGVQIRGSCQFISMSFSSHDDISTNSLFLIFKFYCKMQRITDDFSFSDIANKSQAMSYYEFELFSRDFDILPRFITREELKEIWRNMSSERIKKGDQPLTSLRFEDFKEIIVRLALSMYNKPGLKKLIRASTGDSPSAVDKVQYLCHYLQLDDLVEVKRMLMTKAHKTQGDLNFKSQSESGSRIKHILEEENESRKIIRQLREGKILKHRTSARVRLLVNHSLDTNAQIAGKNKVIPRSPFDDKDVVSISDFPLPSKVDNLLRQIPGSVTMNDPSSVGSPSPVSKPPEALKVLPESDDISCMESIAEELSVKRSIEEKSPHDGDSVLCSVQSGGTRTTKDLQMEYFSRMLVGYEPSLIRLLDRYCEILPGDEKTDVFFSDAPFIDLGTVYPGLECKVTFQVINSSRDDIHIDVSCSNLECSDASVATFSKILAPGISRSIKLSFTIEEGFRTVLGRMSILIVIPRSGKRETLDCPICYRVAPNCNVEDVISSKRCTIRNLAMISSKYINTPMKETKVSFETPTGTWRPSSSTSSKPPRCSSSQPYHSNSLHHPGSSRVSMNPTTLTYPISEDFNTTPRASSFSAASTPRMHTPQR